MWPFRKRISLKDSGIFKNFTDCHSHILPGVDDGVQTMEEALEILRLYEELGIKSVWLTPHIMEDMPNTTLHLRERYAELQATYSGPIKLHLASENMLDNLFEERLEKNDLLPLGESGHDDDIRSLVLAGHKFQVGTQYAECLVDDVTVALLDDNGLDFLRFLS